MATYSWPSSGGTAGSNPSVSLIGQSIPGDATLVGGENPSGNLMALQTDANGYLYISLGGAGVEPIPVSQSGVWNITNITGTISLPTGASTSALQTSGNTTLTTISTTLGSILLDLTNGTQVTSVNNFPATQPVSGTVAATQSGTWNITNISGTVSLPTGAATAANQSTEITSLATIATNTTGVSTAANQTTGNTSLASILANQTNGTQTTALLAGTAVIGTAIIEPRNGTLTDGSGTTSGTPSTSTQIFAANSSRRYLLIENVSTTATIWINFTSAATAANGSYTLLPGGSIVQETGFVSTEVVNVLSTVASVPFTAKQA